MRKMKRFADGGSDKYKAKYDRKVADIESDYEKAKARKTGRAAEVAKAKYEQRMADAKDDLAKWTKSDRTETRAAEKAAERELTMTRRFGGRKIAALEGADKPLGQARPSDAELTKLTSDASQKFRDSGSFKAAFAAARKDPSKPKTFTWRGTSYTTELASEKPKAAARSTGSGRGTPPASGRGTPPAAGRGTPPASGRGTPPASGRGTPPAAGRGTPPAAGRGTPPATTKDTSPWAKDAKGNWVNPEARGTRMGDVLTLGLTAAARNSSPSSGRNAYSAMSDYYKNKDKAAAAAKAKEDKDRAARIAAGKKGMEEAIRSGKKLEAPQLLKAPGAKKGGSIKGYAKGGKIDGCAVRGKTKAGRK